MAWTIPATVAASGVIQAATTNAIIADLAIIGGALTSYTPTTTGITLGNGTVTGRFKQVDKMVDFTVVFTFGSTSALTASPTFTLPVTAATSLWGAGDCTAWDTSPGDYYDLKAVASTTTALGVRTAPTTAGNPLRLLSSAVPFTWATGDVLSISGRYEAA